MKRKNSTRLFDKPKEIITSRLHCTENVECAYCCHQHPEQSPSKTIFGIDYQGFELAYCHHCGLKFLSKRPSSAQQIAEIYSDYWEETPLPEYIRMWTADSQKQIRILNHHASTTQGQPMHILDIGCGNGFFLKIAQEQGWHIYGTELNPSQCQRLRDEIQCPVYEGNIVSCSLSESFFDIVRLYHVLEHVHDPMEDLKECFRILKPGGILYVSVPNTGSWLYRVKDFQSYFHLKLKPYKHYAALHHNWFFTKKMLNKFSTAAGFSTLQIDCLVHSKPRKAAGLHAVYEEICRRIGIGQIVDLYARKPE